MAAANHRKPSLERRACHPCHAPAVLHACREGSGGAHAGMPFASAGPLLTAPCQCSGVRSQRRAAVHLHPSDRTRKRPPSGRAASSRLRQVIQAFRQESWLGPPCRLRHMYSARVATPGCDRPDTSPSLPGNAREAPIAMLADESGGPEYRDCMAAARQSTHSSSACRARCTVLTTALAMLPTEKIPAQPIKERVAGPSPGHWGLRAGHAPTLHIVRGAPACALGPPGLQRSL